MRELIIVTANVEILNIKNNIIITAFVLLEAVKVLFFFVGWERNTRTLF